MSPIIFKVSKQTIGEGGTIISPQGSFLPTPHGMVKRRMFADLLHCSFAVFVLKSYSQAYIKNKGQLHVTKKFSLSSRSEFLNKGRGSSFEFKPDAEAERVEP